MYLCPASIWKKSLKKNWLQHKKVLGSVIWLYLNNAFTQNAYSENHLAMKLTSTIIDRIFLVISNWIELARGIL